LPFFFLLPPVKQRRGRRAPAVPGPEALEHGGKREQGEKGEGDEGIPSPTSIWVGIRRDGGATEDGGWRAVALWRRRCGARRWPGNGGKWREG